MFNLQCSIALASSPVAPTADYVERANDFLSGVTTSSPLVKTAIALACIIAWGIIVFAVKSATSQKLKLQIVMAGALLTAFPALLLFTKVTASEIPRYPNFAIVYDSKLSINNNGEARSAPKDIATVIEHMRNSVHFSRAIDPLHGQPTISGYDIAADGNPQKLLRFLMDKHISYVLYASSIPEETRRTVYDSAKDRVMYFLVSPQPKSTKSALIQSSLGLTEEKLTIGYYVSPEQEADAVAATIAKEGIKDIILVSEEMSGGDSYGKLFKTKLQRLLADDQVNLNTRSIHGQDELFRLKAMINSGSEQLLVITGNSPLLIEIATEFRGAGFKGSATITHRALDYASPKVLNKLGLSVIIPWPIAKAIAQEAKDPNAWTLSMRAAGLYSLLNLISGAQVDASTIDNAELMDKLFDSKFCQDPEVEAPFGQVRLQKGPIPQLIVGHLQLHKLQEGGK